MVVNSALVTALLMSGLAAAGAGAVAVGAAALAAVFAFGAAFGAAVAALSAAFGLAAGGVALPSAGGGVVAADEPAALAGCSLPVTAPLGAVADADSLPVLGVVGAVGAVGSVGDTGVRVTVSGVFFCKISGKYGLAMPRS